MITKKKLSKKGETMIEYFAEIGSNYIVKEKAYLDRALKLIDAAQRLGCMGVKFQYFKAKSLWHPSMKKEIEAAQQRELLLDWIPVLSKSARKQGMLFGLSVFDCESVAEVNDHVDYFKIASFEAGWLDLVRTCYKTGKRLMISLGQSSKIEIIEIIKNLPPQETQIDLLHCVSKYPAKVEDCNLNVIKDPLINGYSDHTALDNILLTAVTLGAEVLEFHLDLADCKGIENGHSWTPGYFQRERGRIILIQKALGTSDWGVIVDKQNRKYKANPITGLRGK
jgi:N-acetylneuraminate synthase